MLALIAETKSLTQTGEELLTEVHSPRFTETRLLVRQNLNAVGDTHFLLYGEQEAKHSEELGTGDIFYSTSSQSF